MQLLAWSLYPGTRNVATRAKKRPVVFFDPDSGEVIPVTLEKRRGARFTFPGGFVVIGLETFRIMRRLNLPKDAHHIFYFLLERVAIRNLVLEATNVRIAQECGLDPARVSRMIRMLENGQLLQRGAGRGNIYVNPNLCFRGSAAEQGKAAELWNRSHIRVVPPREERSA